MTSSGIENAIKVLNRGLEGRLILPADPDYDAARAIVSNGADKRPGAIARGESAADVQRTIEVARNEGLELAVRRGGHFRVCVRW